MNNPQTESKTVECDGPSLTSTIREAEQSGWRCVAVEVTGASDYVLHLERALEPQRELLP